MTTAWEQSESVGKRGNEKKRRKREKRGGTQRCVLLHIGGVIVVVVGEGGGGGGGTGLARASDCQSLYGRHIGRLQSSLSLRFTFSIDLLTPAVVVPRQPTPPLSLTLTDNSLALSHLAYTYNKVKNHFKRFCMSNGRNDSWS